MTQTGRTCKVYDRAYEDYQSLHKYLRHSKGDRVVEFIHQHKQLSTNTAVDVSNKGTTPITITTIGKTETNLQVISSGADAGLLHAVITAHYKDADGVAHTAIIADATADMSGATDFDTPVTDFYCWDESYGTSAFNSSLAVGVGLTLSAGAAGTGNAQIIAAAKVGTLLSFVGVGAIYGQEVGAANTSAGFVIQLDYKTPWGEQKIGYETVNANADLQGQQFLDADGFPIGDFYRVDTLVSDTVMADEFEITNYAVNAFYGVIDIGNYESVHTRYMALGEAYGKSYFGELISTFPTVADTLTTTITMHGINDDEPHAVSIDTFVNQSQYIALPEQLEPLSEVTVTINDQNVAHAYANITLRVMEVV
ncbi:MAG: hypothetical protein WC315_07610 [Candidatus Omnitrophota bacterium]|jgi:hypothetical protein